MTLSADKIRFTRGFNLSDARRPGFFCGMGEGLTAAFTALAGFASFATLTGIAATGAGLAVTFGFAAATGCAARPARPSLVVLPDNAGLTGLAGLATLAGLAGTGFIDKLFPLGLNIGHLGGVVYKDFDCNSTTKRLIFQG